MQDDVAKMAGSVKVDQNCGDKGGEGAVIDKRGKVRKGSGPENKSGQGGGRKVGYDVGKQLAKFGDIGRGGHRGEFGDGIVRKKVIGGERGVGGGDGGEGAARPVKDKRGGWKEVSVERRQKLMERGQFGGGE
jgi:hypothetical protein